MKATLTLFDLDHTLLVGDSDVLWCEFLMQRGVLDRACFEPRNRDMEARYQAGTVGVQEFCEFYVSTLAGRSRGEWQPLREAFLHESIIPRLAPRAAALVAEHRAGDDWVVMTTATNRFLTELSARHFGIEHLIATECEVGADGRFTGRTSEVLNMREGKLVRLQQWSAAHGLTLERLDITVYSDSINDLPLLGAAQHPVAVDPDARLREQARQRGWPVISLR